MATESAGLLMYRGRGGNLQVLLVHPGGPFDPFDAEPAGDGSWTPSPAGPALN